MANSHIASFNEHNKINEDANFGNIIIKIEGDSKHKLSIINGIRSILSKFQGERHLFVDDKEVSPYFQYGRGGGG